MDNNNTPQQNLPPESTSNQGDTLPPHEQKTMQHARYDYSHLRESKNNDGHWYAYPSSAGEVTQQSAAATRPGAHNANISMNPVLPPPIEAPLQQPPIPAIPAPVGAGHPVRRRIEQRKHRKATGMPDKWAWVIIASALLGVTVIGSVMLVFVIRYAVRGSGEEVAALDVPQIEPTSIIYAGENEAGDLEGNSLELINKKWDGQERFTILLMGLDKRPGESGSAFRTDSMMLVSLDPRTNSIGILSIPRDLYVEVPYQGLHRVNAAYVIGELEQPGGGPTAAMQAVQYNFGIRVNEFMTVDFQSVIAIIDAIGGIDIEVPSEITDYSYPTMDYGTETFHVDAGWQNMDGTTALKYARTRHASDDIDRASRQQQVVYAVRDRVTSLGMVDDLIVQAPFLYGQLRSGINTGLSLDQMIELALWAQDVPRENIHNGVVSWEYLSGYQTPTGGSVLVPNRSRIGELMVSVFGANYNQ
ncbi:MAG TPA: LCP family protein [Aggregatilineales bacterium]|nr:LCP family protein [Aggregatilineales bacterium]